MRSWSRTGLRQITLRLGGNQVPRPAALHPGQLRQTRPTTGLPLPHPRRCQTIDPVHASLMRWYPSWMNRSSSGTRDVGYFCGSRGPSPSRCRGSAAAVGSRATSSMMLGSTGNRARRASSAGSLRPPERPTTKSVCTRPPAGSRSAATSTSGYEPHTNTRSPTVVCVVMYRPGSVGSGRSWNDPGTNSRTQATTSGIDIPAVTKSRPVAPAVPVRDHRHGQQHQRRHDLQPVVAEEPEPGRPMRQARSQPTATDRGRRAATPPDGRNAATAPTAPHHDRMERRRTRHRRHSSPSAAPDAGARRTRSPGCWSRSTPRTRREVRRSPSWRR